VAQICGAGAFLALRGGGAARLAAVLPVGSQIFLGHFGRLYECHVNIQRVKVGEMGAENVIFTGMLRKNHSNCHSEEPAGDEESRIALRTLRARSFAAAQDDSVGRFSVASQRSSLVIFASEFAGRKNACAIPRTN
jgi:hypothetical protein